VWVDAEDTKGGQQSIFADGITGGFHLFIWRAITPCRGGLSCMAHYSHLPPATQRALRDQLSSFHTGEIQPQYIMRYGFYEGHTYLAD
jgi:hypothetical protein